jgi:hypothetical protein
VLVYQIYLVQNDIASTDNTHGLAISLALSYLPIDRFRHLTHSQADVVAKSTLPSNLRQPTSFINSNHSTDTGSDTDAQ